MPADRNRPRHLRRGCRPTRGGTLRTHHPRSGAKAPRGRENSSTRRTPPGRRTRTNSQARLRDRRNYGPRKPRSRRQPKHRQPASAEHRRQTSGNRRPLLMAFRLASSSIGRQKSAPITPSSKVIARSPVPVHTSSTLPGWPSPLSGATVRRQPRSRPNESTRLSRS